MGGVEREVRSADLDGNATWVFDSLLCLMDKEDMEDDGRDIVSKIQPNLDQARARTPGEDRLVDGMYFVFGGDAVGTAAYYSLDDFPNEFFGHQLMELNADDMIEVFAFVEEWGFPFWPGGYFSGDSTEAAYRYLLACGKAPAGVQVISAEEAMGTLQVMQIEVRDFFEGFTHGWEVARPSYVFMNYGGSSPVVADTRIPHNLGAETDGRFNRNRDYYVANLTTAICNDFLETLVDRAPWRVCECEGCGRIYKHKQTKHKSDRARRSNSHYCSDRCYERQKKRNARKSRAPRIDHGIDIKRG